ncbi:uncharacterized protein TNCV_1225301 [Trichonephila clavipes]|nr:uncharacterized protein TNCV_1225301 [Trichonephila clavipes]
MLLLYDIGKNDLKHYHTDRQEGGRLKTGGLSGLLISLTNLDMSLSMIRCITWIPETTVRSIDRRLRKGWLRSWMPFHLLPLVVEHNQACLQWC